MTKPNIDPDHKKKIKRIIAREGLVLLFIVFLSSLLIRFNFYVDFIISTGICKLGYVEENFFIHGNFNEIQEAIMRTNITVDRARLCGFILPFGIYLFIRFIIWAVRTLRER